MNNDTDNPSHSPNDDPLKKYEKAKKDFEEAVENSHKGNEDLKNRMFFGCLGLAGIMISAAAASGKSQLGGMAWGIYAAQTVMVVLFVFGLQALAVAISLIALNNPKQPLWRWIACVWRWITCVWRWIACVWRWATGKKKDEPAPYASYDRLTSVANYMDMSCLFILAGWSIYMAVRIAVTLLCL